jgi:hypothetical protein
VGQRVNISVPDDLKKRMDKMDKTEDVNWSQVATAAFEAKLAEIASRKAERNMDDIVQRLRASKKASMPKDEAFELGQEWAKHRAEWSQLEKLASTLDSTEFEAKFQDKEWGYAVYFLITLDPGLRGSGFLRMAEEIFGKDQVSPEFTRSFWSGAVAVYNEVKDQV